MPYGKYPRQFPTPDPKDGEVSVFQTANGSARAEGQRPTGPSGEKSRHAPTVRGGPNDFGGNRTGE